MQALGGILFDLDGVIYEGNRLIPGAVKTLKKIQPIDIVLIWKK